VKLDQIDSKLLNEVGFQPGYPMFSVPNGDAADDLQKIIHALTFPPRSGEGLPSREPADYTPGRAGAGRIGVR
jgi:hypothetical protein